jgi:hypothetical protein
MTTPTDYRVDFGAHLEHHAYFRDRAKAEQYAANSHGVVVALCECKDEQPKEQTQ